MKNLNHFELFKIGKSQMSKLSGGYVVCDVYYTDGKGGSTSIRFDQASKSNAKQALQAQHPDAKITCLTLD